MARHRKKKRWFVTRKFLFMLASALILGCLAVVLWIAQLDQNIQKRFAEKRFAPPVEFYSAPEDLRNGYQLPKEFLESLFSRKRFRTRDFSQPLHPGDFSVWNKIDCQSVIQLKDPTPLEKCIAFQNTDEFLIQPDLAGPQVIALDSSEHILATFSGQPLKASLRATIEPELFAQYYGDKPILRKMAGIGDTPVACFDALLSIEDSSFLEHSGVSITGVLRAIVTNLKKGKKAQGGSTITQQLVKNYFLTEERTFKRKITEMAMAFLVESRVSKDEILETYINLIYMGANGPFQIRGWGAAAEHYFGSELRDLNLEQCALLAALVNGPGVFDPFTHPEQATKRRAKVLDRMVELKKISPEQGQIAKAAPLPTRPHKSLTEPAPYFVQSTRRQLNEIGLDETEGLRVFTTLNLRAQEAAHQAVRGGIERLEKNYPHVQKLKDQGKNIEAVLLSADPFTGYITAIEGGRNYKLTQYNRAYDSHRQVGSIMKPFVYLSALESTDESGKPYTPITILKDESFTHKYQGQSWTPKNYENKFLGEIPLFFALKESLNVPTARLGLAVGLSNIIDTAKRLGLQSKIEPLPSLTLGAFELYPWEVLASYNSLANLGTRHNLTYIIRAENLSKQLLFDHKIETDQAVNAEAAAQLVGIMKQTVLNGTARGVTLANFIRPAAGKTGTTNDKKDAWFSGFTPFHTAVVWVGYDDNTSHNLTGGAAAVPIWTQYMKDFAQIYPDRDFQWPESVEAASLSPDFLHALGVPDKSAESLKPIQLIFRKGQSPAGATIAPVGP